MINYNDYLADIGITDGVVKDKVEKIIAYYNKFYDLEKLKDIFISDYISEDGNRNYTSLWLIYENRICEAKNFITEVDLDSGSYPMNNIVYWNLKSKELIGDEIKDSDRLLLDVIFTTGVTGNFKAAKNNCRHLLRILKTYFV